MPQEFHILKGKGDNYEDYSEAMAEFEEDDYQILLTQAKEANLPLFSSMDNYYGEYKIYPAQLDSFLNEISILSSKSSNEIQKELGKLINVVNQAKSENLPVATIPD